MKELHDEWGTFYWTHSIQNPQMPSEQAGQEMTDMGSRRPAAPTSGSKSHREIKYWDLFVERCQQESVQIQKSNWILADDVLSCSATATIAVPGVAIGMFCEKYVQSLLRQVALVNV